MRQISSIVIALAIFASSAPAQSANRSACAELESDLPDDAIGARFELAICYQRAGRFARAWALYRESIDIANKTGDVERSLRAQTSASALEPHLARLTIVAPLDLPAGFAVQWDGRSIEPDSLGVGLYADPGRHELVASAPGFKHVKRITTLAGGRARRLAIPALAASQAPQDESATLAAEDTAPDLVVAPELSIAALSPLRDRLVLGLGAASLATAGGSVAFLARARSSLAEAKLACGPDLTCTTSVDYSRGKQLLRNARFSTAVAKVFAIASGAAIVADAIVVLTRTGARKRGMTGLVPVAHERGAGLTLVGRF